MGLKELIQEARTKSREREFLRQIKRNEFEPENTVQAMIVNMGNTHLLEATNLVLRKHNLLDITGLPEGTKGDISNCPLAKVLGGEVYEDIILNLGYLATEERLILLEFFQRFDMGEYPDLEIKRK